MDNINEGIKCSPIENLKGPALVKMESNWFKPLKIRDVPLSIFVEDKRYRVKSNLFEGDLSSNKDISLFYSKVFKLHTLIIYLSISEAYIDTGYYIEENDLWDLLEEIK